MKLSFVVPAVMLALVAGCATPEKKTAAGMQPLRPVELTSSGTKLALMPSAVQKTILAYGGTAEIKDISKLEMDRDIYRVEFSNPAGNPTIFIREDGAPMNGSIPIYTPSSFSTALPPPVTSALQQQAPRAAITSVAPKEMTSYEVTFADTNSHPNMLILQDGTVLKP